ncbi:MAG: hypothetical protein LH610_08005 [Sphingomonas bacterium]|nr:hypothetical protein [Sphingomonas bacterium]
MRKLGIGPAAVSRRKFTEKCLADAIEIAVTNDSLRERAPEIGRLVRAEHGAARAATAIVEGAKA